jgi:hypothetical protein
MRVHDATGGRAPSAADCANARAFYNQVLAANAKYADINVAIANNFKPGHDAPGSPATHYVFWGATGLMDPNHPQGLMYKIDPTTHQATWLGVMFVERSGPLPQPGGSLTVWHDHGVGQQEMFHVWTFAGAADPFALMLPDAIGH